MGTRITLVRALTFLGLTGSIIVVVGFAGSLITSAAEPRHGIKQPGKQQNPERALCCSVIANPALKGRLGRVVVAYPEGASPGSSKAEVMKANDQKALNSGYGPQTFDLLPGLYDVKISGKLVTGVTVKSGHDTNVKVGVLRVTAGGSTNARMVKSGEGKYLQGQANHFVVFPLNDKSSLSNQRIGLPGTYAVALSDQSVGIQVKIVVSQMSNFPATQYGSQRIQVKPPVNLTAQVIGGQRGTPKLLYRFSVEAATEYHEVLAKSGEFAPNPQWVWDPTCCFSTQYYGPIKFIVRVKVDPRQAPIARQRPHEIVVKSGVYGLVDDRRSQEIFSSSIGPVITHPRCRNCHASGNSPTQGDDRHLHSPTISRDVDCTQCHKDTNGETPGSPPGTPDWRMAPANLAFGNKTAEQICHQMTDPTKNGGLSLKQLQDHVGTSRRIQWAFHPGLQRTTPPGYWEKFSLQDFVIWMRTGAACPPVTLGSLAVQAPVKKVQETEKRQEIRSDGSCCEVIANSALKGRLGRLVVAYPEGVSPSSTKVEVMKAGDKNVLKSGYGPQTFDLLPGVYDVRISGKLVAGVTVQSVHDTTVKVGVLRITAGGSTKVEVLAQEGGPSLTNGYGNQLIGLPIGTYTARLLGMTETLTIQDGQITDF